MNIEKRTYITNRRYIGVKTKLLFDIFQTMYENIGKLSGTFLDLFGGTGSVTNYGIENKLFDNFIINDILVSNNVIYKGFFGNGEIDERKVKNIIKEYNQLKLNGLENIEDNFFSENFGNNTYLEHNISKYTGYVRQDLENKKKELTEKEYCVLLSSLLYHTDKFFNTTGIQCCYLKKDNDNMFFDKNLQRFKKN